VIDAMEMHQIRYFLAVCETLNFTRAAEQCNVTQPALTRAVQKLEEELGGLMFRRERGLTHLTDFGKLMQPQLARVMQDAGTALTTAKSFLKMEDAPLHVGVMCTIGPILFMGFLARFRADNPGIELTLNEDVPGNLLESLRTGAVDLAVMAHPGKLEERFVERPLYRERFVVAFPPGHRLERQNAVSVTDLAGESYLSRINCEYYDQLADACVARGVKLLDAYRSEREDWIQTMVMAGMGICFLPEYSPLLPGLPTRPLIEGELFREVSLVTVAGRRFSPATTAFVKAIQAYGWPTMEPLAAAAG
jgi:DNA-binding transcriptional LysR family regulator